MSTPKGTPLTKEEVALLIGLVESNKVIISKATNAINNRLKEAAWTKISKIFNASVSSGPRRVEQLKLKWENLKKAARKRSASIKLNHNTTGTGKPENVPIDDTLARVATILSAGDGDGVSYGDDDECKVDPLDIESDGGDGIVLFDGDQDEEKRKQMIEDDDTKARIARNKAIADYYNVKRRLLVLEIENMELRNEKIKLESENLELANKKLKLDIEKGSND